MFLQVCPLWALASWLNSKTNLIWHNTLGGFSHSYSVQPQFTHSSSNILQYRDLRPYLLLAWVGRGCKGHLGLWWSNASCSSPFLRWNSLFWIWKSCSVWGSWMLCIALFRFYLDLPGPHTSSVISTQAAYKKKKKSTVKLEAHFLSGKVSVSSNKR